jgi:dTDP-4-dehydrorhamnose reductase
LPKMSLESITGPVAITGAQGLLGANLVAAAADRGLGTLAIARREFYPWPRVRTAVCDLTHAGRTAEIIQKMHPRAIVHCAAITNVDWCESHRSEAWELHSVVSGRLAEQARRMGAQFVYVSTDSVFDGVHGDYREAYATNPLNAYAQSKLAGEERVLSAMPDALILRTNIYGWNLQPKLSLGEWMLSKLESGTRFQGFTDVWFCPMLVNDLSDVILDLLDMRVTGLYHVAASDACSKYDFARRIANTFSLEASVVEPALIADSSLTARRPKNTTVNVESITTALGRSLPKVDEGLQRFKALRDNGFVARLKGELVGVRNG